MEKLSDVCEKVKKVLQNHQKCYIWHCYAPHTSYLSSNLKFSCNFGIEDKVQAKYFLNCGHV